MRLAYKFSKLNTKLPDILNHQLGPALENDLKILRVNTTTPLREIYFSYMKHMKFYEGPEQEFKQNSIREAYVKVIGERIKNLEVLSDQERKDLRFLMNNNFGFPFVEGERRVEIIANYILEIENKKFYHFPRFSLFVLWLAFGLPSFWIHDDYV